MNLQKPFQVVVHICVIVYINDSIFIRPSSDGTYYGMVMSVRPGLRPTLRPSYSPSVHPGLRPPVFHTYLHTCFDILSWNFAHHFVLLYYRSSSSVVTLRQFLKELCLFWNLEYWKYTVFRSFLWHALTYRAGILHMTLFYCTTDQVRVSSISVNFCRSYAPFWNLEYWKYTVFCTFLLHALTYRAEILHKTLFYCTTDQVRVSLIYVGVMPLLECRILKIHSFPHFSLTCLDILSSNFAFDFVLMYCRSSLSVVYFRQFL